MYHTNGKRHPAPVGSEKRQMRLGLSQKSRLNVSGALVLVIAASLLLWFVVFMAGIGVYLLVERF
jgi:hypothetical protein